MKTKQKTLKCKWKEYSFIPANVKISLHKDCFRAQYKILPEECLIRGRSRADH